MNTRSTIPELRMPLPDFSRWLDERGHTERADDIEAIGVFTALIDLCRRTQAQTADPASEDEQSFLRMWQGMLFAVGELCNIEHKHGRSPHQITATMARVCGTSAMYATASILKDDAPLRSIAKVLVEEFRFAAKASADTIMEANARAAEAAAS